MKLNSHVKQFAVITILIFIAPLMMSSASALVISDSPAVITATCPIFPLIARAANASGEVSVEVKISVTGEVISTHATSGHPLLRKAAEAAAKRWQFTTSTETSGERTAQLTFVFRIMPRCSSTDELTSIFSPPYKIEVRAEKPEIICDDCSPVELQKLRCQNP